MLDKRLRCVAGLVRPGSVLADIGTDHAHLPVWLVKEGVCPRAVAADIRIGPAAAARRSVEAAGLEERIDVRVGDGLAPLCPGEADDIVIAGMGGETIASILEAAPWTKDGRYRLILQPMTRHECLRRFLLTGGFDILSEQIVQEGRRRYLVLAWCLYRRPAGDRRSRVLYRPPAAARGVRLSAESGGAPAPAGPRAGASGGWRGGGRPPGSHCPGNGTHCEG